MVNLIRNWQSPKINAIPRSIFRFTKYVDGSSTVFYPWELGFNTQVALTPIQALYQFEKTKLMEKAIYELNARNLRSINDLRCFHPEAIIHAKQKHPILQNLHRNFRKVC